MLYFRQKTAQVCGNFPKINYIGFWPLCQLSVRELPARTPLQESLFRPPEEGTFLDFRFRIFVFVISSHPDPGVTVTLRSAITLLRIDSFAL